MASSIPTPGTGTEFSFTRAPSLNNSGGIAFVAGLFFEPQGIWRSRNGELTDVVLPNTVLRRGSQTLVIKAIDSIAGFNANDETIARVTLEDDSGVLRGGLVLAGADGELTLLVVQGQLFDVHGDGSELRQVSRLVAGGFNDSGELSFRLDFPGGSSGHFVVARDSDGDRIADGRDNCATTVNPDQRDTDNDGFGNLCDADLNNDGIVNFEDLFMLQLVFLSTDGDADFNGDGVVNFLDLSIFSGLFLAPPG